MPVDSNLGKPPALQRSVSAGSADHVGVAFRRRAAGNRGGCHRGPGHEPAGFLFQKGEEEYRGKEGSAVGRLTGMGGPPSREASEGLRQEVEGGKVVNSEFGLAP